MNDLTLTTLRRDAQAAMQRNDFLQAVEICNRILGAKRNDPVALTLLAQMFLARGQTDEAEGYVNQAIKAQPKAAEHRILLARILMQRTRYPAALAQLDKALKLAPGHGGATVLKANVYELQDKYDRANRVLAPLLKIAPMPDDVGAIQMRLLAHDRKWDAMIALGSRVDAAGPTAPSGRRRRDVLFELARAYERTGDYDAAFATATRANAIGAVPFDPGAYDAQIDALIETFTAERLRELPKASVPTQRAVFIVGMPRTGSTLVERIIHSHPQAYGAGEISAMFRLVHELPGAIDAMQPYPACVLRMTAEQMDAQAAKYLGEITALAPRADRIVNKDLGNFQHVGLLSRVLPGAAVIHCRRSAMDTCLSCYMERLVPTAVPYASDLVHLGRVYRAYARLMEHWRSVLEKPMLEIDYEALVEDQEATSRRIIEFCGLPWDDACLRFHEVKRFERTLSFDQVRRPLYRTAMGRADRFGAHLAPLRAALGDVVGA